MAAALTFALFLPGIIEQGAFTYHAATGLTQEPFLGRWLLLVAAFYLTSAVCYVVKAFYAHFKFPGPTAAPSPGAQLAGSSSVGSDA